MAQRIKVLDAFAGGQLRFEVYRDPDAGWRLTGFDVKSQTPMDAPPAEAAAAINWVKFYAQPQTLGDIVSAGSNDPVMELPFIPGSAGLQLRGDTPDQRSFEIQQGLIRCFLNGIGWAYGFNEAVMFSIRLALSGPDADNFQRLEIVSAVFRFGYWYFELIRRDIYGWIYPIPVTRNSLLSDFRFVSAWLFDSRLTLGPAFGFSNNAIPVYYTGRLFDATEVTAWAENTPLQWGFGIVAGNDMTYELAKLNFVKTDPGITLRAPLNCFQRPCTPVSWWGNRPDWCIEIRLLNSNDQILGLYNDSVAEVVRKSLASVRSGQPLTLLPYLNWDPSLSAAFSWSIWLEIQGEWAAVETQTPSGEVSRPLRWPEDFTGPNAVFKFRIGTLRPNEIALKRGLPVTAEFRSFRTETGDPLTLPFQLLDARRLNPVKNADSQEYAWGRGFRDRLEIEMALQPVRSKGMAQRVRLGAIQLAFGASERESVPEKSEFAIAALESKPLLRFSFKPDPFDGKEPVVEIFSMTLGVFDLRPASQDPLPGEEYAAMFQASGVGSDESVYESHFQPSAPLVLDLRRPDNLAMSGDPPFHANLDETVLNSQSQTLDLHILLHAPRTGGLGTGHRLWVFDRNPQLLSEVRFTDYSAAVMSGLASEVAHFSTRSGAVWAITASAAGYDLVLPPQGVGEAMEKYCNAGHADWPKDVVEDEVIPFRFTPPAVLAVQPAYYRQRYAEPPWNLRRLLGYAGERDPGMAVTLMRFELLYGLAGQVARSDLRLAEIGARLGALPGRQPTTPSWETSNTQLTIYTQRRIFWQNWYPILRSRLAILEPWQTGQGDGDLRLTDGVTYHLRTSARLAFPARLLPDESVLPLDPLWLRPLAPDVPVQSYLEDLSTLPPQDQDAIARQAPGSPLPGGVAWPFESLNLYNQLWKRPASDAGELSRPCFSMLGGWGHQKATFADGQLRIYSDTAMGRTHSVTLEVLGRISVTWHLAKLVIVYERSTLPARQFYKEQDGLRGRPVLRKVKEYVEILELYRAFPDEGSAPLERGFVQGVRFPEGSRRINVTSRWGQDVGVPHSPADQAEGWKVPLWVKGARPADVYPKPQIIPVLQQAQGAGEVPPSLYDPEKLYFFTSTKDGRDPDPHRWPAVQGIDYGWCHPDATTAPEAPDAWKSGNLRTDAVTPDPAVRGGLGPFTFTLQPGSHPVDVMAQRAAALGTGLQNITLMRGYSTPIVGLKFLKDHEGLLQLRDDIQAGFAPARELVGRTGEVLDLHDGPGTQIDELVTGLGNRVDNIRTQAAGLAATMPGPESLCPRLQTQVRRALSPMRVAAKTLGDNFARQTMAKVEYALRNGDVAAAQGALRRATIGIISDDKKTGEWLKLVNRFDSIGLAAGSLLEKALSEVADAGSAVFERLDEFSAALDEMPLAVTDAAVDWSETAKPLRDAKETLHDGLARIDDALGQAARPWIGLLPNGLRIGLLTQWQSVEEKARGVEKVLAGLESAFDELDQVKYDQFLAALPADLQKARAELNGEWKKLLDAVGNQTAQLITKAKDVQDRLINQFKSEWDPIKTRLDQIAKLTSADDLRAGLRRELDHLGAGWDLTLQRVEDQAASAADSACNLLFGAQNAYRDYLMALLAKDRVEQWVRDAFAHMPSAEEVRRRFEALERELGDAARGLLERAGALAGAPLEQLSRPVMAAGDSVLRLIRAFGEAPRVPALDFRLPNFDPSDLTNRLAHIGYYFTELKELDKFLKFLPRPRVDITPVLAKANQLGQDVLNALESTLPTTQLFDRLIPFDLQHFDLRKIFPNFAGLNLADLFDGLKLPEYANQNVKISHGADPQSLRGWLQIDADVPFGDPITLFAFAGLQVRVQGGRFQATSRIEAAANQSPRQTFRGSVGGDWEVSAGGFVLVVIERTALRFDDSGRITFDVRPDNVRLPGPMAWLADLISKFNFGDKGTSFKVTPDGVQVVLDLPLPDIQAGVFGMANLRLGFFFELSIVEGFVITCGANIARRDAPFTLTIFILGGAGWFDFHFRFAPASRELAVSVSVGIMASASLSIALGPIKGGIYAYFGIVATYEARQGASGQLSVTLVIQFIGQVSILGIVSVYLQLGLEAQYSTGGGLVGRGYVRLEIKICWCFTLSIRASVTYEFGKSSGGSRAAVEGYSAASHAHVPNAVRLAAPAVRPSALLPVPADGLKASDTTSIYDKFSTAYVSMFE